MTSRRSLLAPENGGPEESDKNSEPLIPGLPDQIAELCLLYLPYPYQALVSSVSSAWRRAIADPCFLSSKTALSLSSPHIFVLAFHYPTARNQWQSLDPRSGRWFVLPPMPYPKSACPLALACASLPRQGKLFVLGGMRSDAETPMQNTIVYRTSTNRWSVGARMPTPRSFFAAGSVKGKILAVGGNGSGIDETITSECYDPERDTWTETATIDAGLARYESAVVGNKMYVTEGWSWPFTFSPKGWVYDPDEDTWGVMSKVLREGWSGLTVVVDGRLFVISEFGDCPMKVYVAEDDTWRHVGGEKFPREAMRRPFAVNSAEGKIYVVASGLNVAVGRIFEARKWEFKVEWNVVAAPEAFHGFAPSNCQVVYG